MTRAHAHHHTDADAHTDVAATQDSASSLSSTADSIVNTLQGVDAKVNALSKQRLDDQETALDKLFKALFPALVGLVGGKLFQSVWDMVMGKFHPGAADDEKDHQQGLIISMAFAAASAAFGTLLTRASQQSSQAIVRKLEQRRIKNDLK